MKKGGIIAILLFSILLMVSCHKKQGAHFPKSNRRTNINDCDAIGRNKVENKHPKPSSNNSEKNTKPPVKEKPLPKRKLNRNITGPEDINNCKPKKKVKIPAPEVKENKFSRPVSKTKKVFTIAGIVLGSIAFASLTVLVIALSLAFGFIAVSLALLVTFAIVGGIAFLLMQFINQMRKSRLQRRSQQQQHKNPNIRNEEGNDRE